MALSAVAAAFAARLQANWTRCPVRELGSLDGDTPDDAGTFIVMQFPVSNSEQISFGSPGSNVYRDEGAFRLVLVCERAPGFLPVALQWIDELAALFRGKTFDGVRTYAPSQPVIDDRNEDGPYYRLSFSVPYEHDTLG